MGKSIEESTRIQREKRAKIKQEKYDRKRFKKNTEREEREKLEAIKKVRREKLEAIKREKLKQLKLNDSPLYSYFGAIEGGETTLYYLKLKNKFEEIRYKIGVTINNVSQRYPNKFNYEILYEKKLTHANTIEKEIKKEFFHVITDESLLGTDGSEIFKEDVLKMDS